MIASNLMVVWKKNPIENSQGFFKKQCIIKALEGKENDIAEKSTGTDSSESNLLKESDPEYFNQSISFYFPSKRKE